MKKKNPLLSIIIPVYNEEKYIEKVIHRVLHTNTLHFKKEIVVINDGSTDKTTEFLKKFENSLKEGSLQYDATIRIFHKKKNEGKGAAIRKGIIHSHGDLLLIQDADLEYHPNDIVKLLKAIIHKDHKVVYGSRMLGKKKMQHGGALFYYGGKVVNVLTNLLYNLHLTDEATGYKLFNASLLKKIKLSCKKFEFCPEVTAKIAKLGVPIHEVAIRYKGRTIQQGKKIRWKDGVDAIWTLLKYRFST